LQNLVSFIVPVAQWAESPKINLKECVFR